MQDSCNKVKENMCCKQARKNALDTAKEVGTIEIAPKPVVSTKEKQAAKAKKHT